MRGRCRSCGAEVDMLRHERTGKPAPIDVEERPGGNIELRLASPDRLGRRYVYAVVPPDPDVPRLTSHFATCPAAAQHRARP